MYRYMQNNKYTDIYKYTNCHTLTLLLRNLSQKIWNLNEDINHIVWPVKFAHDIHKVDPAICL